MKNEQNTYTEYKMNFWTNSSKLLIFKYFQYKYYCWIKYIVLYWNETTTTFYVANILFKKIPSTCKYIMSVSYMLHIWLIFSFSTAAIYWYIIKAKMLMFQCMIVWQDIFLKIITSIFSLFAMVYCLLYILLQCIGIQWVMIALSIFIDLCWLTQFKLQLVALFLSFNNVDVRYFVFCSKYSATGTLK